MMEYGLIAKPSNVVAITQKVLFLDAEAVKSKYRPFALRYTDKLINALFEYNESHSRRALKTLVNTTNTFVAILKPTMRNIFRGKN